MGNRRQGFRRQPGRHRPGRYRRAQRWWARQLSLEETWLVGVGFNQTGGTLRVTFSNDTGEITGVEHVTR